MLLDLLARSGSAARSYALRFRFSGLARPDRIGVVFAVAVVDVDRWKNYRMCAPLSFVFQIYKAA